MKQAIYLLALGFILSCEGKKEEKDNTHTGVIDSVSSEAPKENIPTRPTAMIGSIQTIEVDPTKIECMPQPFLNEQWTTFRPGTFVDTTYIYASIKPGAAILDTLQFNTPVNILSAYPEFFLICTPNAKAGYVKKTDIYLDNIHGWHLFGITKYGTDDNTSCRESQFKVIKINDKQEIADIYQDSIMGNAYEVKRTYATLKNSIAIFHIYYHCYAEIGVTVDHFIIDNGTKLSRLLISGSSGDGGYSDASTVYLPVTLTNGTKVVLAKNGQLSVDPITGKAEIYPYPKNCGIPIEELIVEESKTTDMLWDDEKGRPKLNKDGTAAEEVLSLQTIYYRWDGKALQKVKTIKGK